MMVASTMAVCWAPVANREREGAGFEHLLLSDGAADSVILALDENKHPFRLAYHLAWDRSWGLRDAEFAVATEQGNRSLWLHTDGHGHWRDRRDQALSELDGCMDIDIWPTPFTNSFPIQRGQLTIGERRQFLVAWVCAPELTVRPQLQAYTRLAERRYRFESLDESGFQVELAVDADGLVLDYPELFRRVI